MAKGRIGRRVAPLIDKKRINKKSVFIYTVYFISHIYKLSFTYTTYTTIAVFVPLQYF